ncbi:MAG: LytTR family transcriptional regulator [Clostridia bacterium]|nr:LytTR family transcriptional regulator [Clostridia bacterium]
MRCNVKIDKDIDERVDIYARERTTLVEQIETLVQNSEIALVGVNDEETVPLDIAEVQRFFVENGKVFASVGNQRYAVRYRIYQLEEMLKDSFIKINQSSLVQASYIKRFVAGWDGALTVELKNGDKDFVSRRQTKIVLSRLKLK